MSDHRFHEVESIKTAKVLEFADKEDSRGFYTRYIEVRYENGSRFRLILFSDTLGPLEIVEVEEI